MIKPKGRHFDTIQVIEANSQAALDTLKVHDFQDALKRGRSAGKDANARKDTASSFMVTN
jgi:hypothetical protein